MIAEYADIGEHTSAFLHEVRLERATTDDREFEEGGTEKQSPLDQEDRVDVDGIAVAVSTDGRKDSLSAMDQGKNGSRKKTNCDKIVRNKFKETKT